MIDSTTKKFTQASVRDNDDRLPLQLRVLLSTLFCGGSRLNSFHESLYEFARFSLNL